MTSGPPRLPRPAAQETAVSPRITVLAATARGGQDAARRAEAAFWDEVTAIGTPLVEPIPGDPGHRAVTFLWRATPETHRVIAMVNRLFDPLNPSASQMRCVEGTGVWHITYRLRTDHAGSYRILDLTDDALDLGPRAMHERGVHDPFNAWSIPTRWGDARASVFELPDAPVAPWRPWRDTPVAPYGSVRREQIPSVALGAPRDTWVYMPQGQIAATLVLLDGDMWFGKLGVSALFDRLITARTIPPLAVLSPHAISNPTRMTELAGHAGFARFLSRELLPWARDHFPIPAGPALLAGESLGGLTALTVGLTASGFDGVLAQSASLWWRPANVASTTGSSWVAEQCARAGHHDLRVHLRVGAHEWAVLQQHRHLRDTLTAHGHPVAYTEYNGGHDYVCWTRGLAEGITDHLRTTTPRPRP
ncbi:alpha/beta hydrolase-fold protein [Actinomadura nitritigenes]|uniref:alpha/beta hydrolase-fold protein n=1 Tax=Actinomadura nitritigenes TaxID=134602 RepID=UPI003D91962B